MVYGYSNTLPVPLCPIRLSTSPPLAREQDNTARAEQRGKAAEKRTTELDEGVAELRRTVHSEARPSSALSEAQGFALRSCAWASKGGAWACERGSSVRTLQDRPQALTPIW
jgi:hypothetical protein